MVRQRLTQDYQLVPPSNVNASNYRGDLLRDNVGRKLERAPREGEANSLRYFLSLGHRLQVLTYDRQSDTVAVTHYNIKDPSGNNSFKYFYYSFSKESNSYTKVVQTFAKYSQLCNWNKLDRIVCGNPNREMDETMRARRVSFLIIPDEFGTDVAKEEEYISKFRRLLDYLGKLRRTDDSPDKTLDIGIVSSTNSTTTPAMRTSEHIGIERGSMKRFCVQLKGRKQDPTEWVEIAMDLTFNTSWTYRIVLNWLVATAGKVENQIQLIQRRCGQFGLQLIPTPQVSVSDNIFLNPFRAPAIFSVKDSIRGGKIDDRLLEAGFIYDGKFWTKAREVVECIKNGKDFAFQPRKPIHGEQFLHRSGTLFVRIVRDMNGVAMIIAFANARYMGRDEGLQITFRRAFGLLRQCVDGKSSPELFPASASTVGAPPIPFTDSQDED